MQTRRSEATAPTCSSPPSDTQLGEVSPATTSSSDASEDAPTGGVAEADKKSPAEGVQFPDPRTVGRVTTNNAGLVRVLTAERLIAALPGTGRPSAVPARPVMLTSLPALPLAARIASSEGTYGFTRLDDHGRCRDAVTFAALGWDAGTRLTITELTAGVVRVTANPTGEACLDPRGRLRLPRALRERVGLSAASPLVLHADACTGVLDVLPPASLDAARTLLDGSRDIA